MTTAYLRAPRYVLGEIEADHSTIADLPARARAFGMREQAELWGWGTIRRTERSLEELAIDSGRATLGDAAVDRCDVDGLVLCSTRFPGGPETHGRFVRAIMTGLGLDDVAFTGITLNRCTNMLAALQTAEALVVSGRRACVLVVTTDRVVDETTRMERFALFSDGAASCVVTGGRGGHGDYEVVACAAAQDTRELDWQHEISAALSRRVNDSMLGALRITLGDVAGLMHANLYRPLVVLKERQAGFSAAQLYTDNIARFGHCFAADPVINLVDREAAGAVRDGHYYMLASSVPGSRMAVLLRKGEEPR